MDTTSIIVGPSIHPLCPKWWSYNKTAKTKALDLYVWVRTTTLLCSIFLPVLVKAIPCIGKDLGMCTGAYTSLTVQLHKDGYTSKTRETRLFEGNRADRFGCLGEDHYLVVLHFLPMLVKAIPCIGKDLGMCTGAYVLLTVQLHKDGYTSKTTEYRLFEGNRADRFGCLGEDHYLVVLHFPASACQSHPMYR